MATDQVTLVHPVMGVELIPVDSPPYSFWGSKIWELLKHRDKRQLAILPPTAVMSKFEVIRCDRFNPSPGLARVSMPPAIFVSESYEEAVWWAVVTAEEIWGE